MIFSSDNQKTRLFAASVWGGDCAADGTITLLPGESKTCTITNDDIAPNLTLIKTVVNDNYGTAITTDWTLYANGPTPISGAGEVTSNSTFSAGTYDLSESTGPDYYLASDWDCGEFTMDDVDTITLDLGESATCTITNDDLYGTVRAFKFYDANANGVYDGDDEPIEGWKFEVLRDSDVLTSGFTGSDGIATFDLFPGDYTIREVMPGETWMSTTPQSVAVTVELDSTEDVEFGNLCLGEGGGLTPGFWSSKNGNRLIGEDDLSTLRNLNLKDENGSDFDPNDFDEFMTWILAADAGDNMAYKLSSHLAAMELNVYNGKVDGNALIYAPGTSSANPLGYATVNEIMAEANDALYADSYTPSGDENRDIQEALKDALDYANSNENFVQPEPCPFSYPSEMNTEETEETEETSRGKPSKNK